MRTKPHGSYRVNSWAEPGDIEAVDSELGD